MLTLIRFPFHPRVTAVARKRPRSVCQSAGGRLHVITHTPLTQRSRSGLTMPLSWQAGNLSGNELARNLSGNIRPQSSQLAEPLWTDPGIKSGISVHELISISKKKEKHKRGLNGPTFSQNPRKRGKSHRQHNQTHCIVVSSPTKALSRLVLSF